MNFTFGWGYDVMDKELGEGEWMRSWEKGKGLGFWLVSYILLLTLFYLPI
jgi:hypothetical protein